jgi:diacylglycerol kinase (ATP)
VTIKSLLVVMNPHGGVRRGHLVLEQVRPVFAVAEISVDVRVTEHAGHAGKLAHTLDLRPYDGICVIGGDGTLHEVADGLMRRDEPNLIPLGIVPAGTGNTIAKHLGCEDPVEAARRILLGQTQGLDVVRVALRNEVIFCIDIVGWGAVADINAVSERLRAFGPWRYNVASLWHILRAKRRRARLVLDGRSLEDDFHFVLACNAKYTGLGMKLAPHAELNDGKVDVIVVRRATRRQMFKLFAKVFDGSHLALDYVEYHQVRSFAINTDDPTDLDLDGEMKGQTPMSAEVLPSALRVFA